MRAFCCLAKQYSAIRFQHSLLELIDVEWTRLPAGLAVDQRKPDGFDVGAPGLAAANQVANMFAVAGVSAYVALRVYQGALLIGHPYGPHN